MLKRQYPRWWSAWARTRRVMSADSQKHLSSRMNDSIFHCRRRYGHGIPQPASHLPNMTPPLSSLLKYSRSVGGWRRSARHAMPTPQAHLSEWRWRALWAWRGSPACHPPLVPSAASAERRHPPGRVSQQALNAEWLESDGCGVFASGTACGCRILQIST